MSVEKSTECTRKRSGAGETSASAYLGDPRRRKICRLQSGLRLPCRTVRVAILSTSPVYQGTNPWSYVVGIALKSFVRCTSENFIGGTLNMTRTFNLTRRLYRFRKTKRQHQIPHDGMTTKNIINCATHHSGWRLLDGIWVSQLPVSRSKRISKKSPPLKLGDMNNYMACISPSKSLPLKDDKSCNTLQL